MEAEKGRALVMGLADEEGMGRFWHGDCEGSWSQLGRLG